MKKLNSKILFITVILIISAVISAFPVSVSALKNGDKLGDVLNSDVKTYINGYRIPCYNIKNKAVVLVADLKNYGFDVNYNSKTRTSLITRNYEKQFTPIKDITNTTSGKRGTVAFAYVYSDITAKLGNANTKIESFNIQGNLAVFFESLGEYGTFSWESATKSSKLNLKSAPSNTTVSTNNVSAGTNPDEIYLIEEAEKIIELLNKERRRIDAPLLKVNNDLMKVAAIRAKELAEVYSHTRPDGTSAHDLAKDSVANAWWGAECINGATIRADGFGVVDNKTNEIVVSASLSDIFVKTWTNSDAHYKAYTNRIYTDVGICMYQEGYMIYVSLLMAAVK